jgi:hypothetical protein
VLTKCVRLQTIFIKLTQLAKLCEFVQVNLISHGPLYCTAIALHLLNLSYASLPPVLSFGPSSLAVGKSCAIIVVLFADIPGPSLSATLNIHNNATRSPQTVPLSATVTKTRDE